MTQKRNYSIRFLIALLFFALPANAFADFTGKVVAVKDGDTVEVMREGVAVCVRLNGIDCPEKGQAFGQRAKKFTSDLCFGRRVEVMEKGRDRYGRTIGEVMLEDGRNLNQELVRSGMAWWYRKYAEKDTNLESLERHAREARTGLWVDADPTPPWNWRKRRQIKK